MKPKCNWISAKILMFEYESRFIRPSRKYLWIARKYLNCCLKLTFLLIYGDHCSQETVTDLQRVVFTEFFKPILSDLSDIKSKRKFDSTLNVFLNSKHFSNIFTLRKPTALKTPMVIQIEVYSKVNYSIYTTTQPRQLNLTCFAAEPVSGITERPMLPTICFTSCHVQMKKD